MYKVFIIYLCIITIIIKLSCALYPLSLPLNDACNKSLYELCLQIRMFAGNEIFSSTEKLYLVVAFFVTTRTFCEDYERIVLLEILVYCNPAVVVLQIFALFDLVIYRCKI